MGRLNNYNRSSRQLLPCATSPKGHFTKTRLGVRSQAGAARHPPEPLLPVRVSSALRSPPCHTRAGRGWVCRGEGWGAMGWGPLCSPRSPHPRGEGGPHVRSAIERGVSFASLCRRKRAKESTGMTALACPRSRAGSANRRCRCGRSIVAHAGARGRAQRPPPPNPTPLAPTPLTPQRRPFPATSMGPRRLTSRLRLSEMALGAGRPVTKVIKVVTVFIVNR